jgi:uncharacterized membrane protein
MTLDHASYAFNAQRYVTDSMVWYQPGSAIPAAQFLLRWVTHLCAPTFVFLAGLGLAFSIARKKVDGIVDRRVDVDMLWRGLFIMALDPLWMSFGFGGKTVFQVLYAIGGGLCCMVVLRRMGTHALLGIGLALMVGGEAIAGLAVWLGGGEQPGTIGAFLATGGKLGAIGFVLYPLLPWLAYMILGFGWGRLMVAGSVSRPVRGVAVGGIILLVMFAVIRGLNGYGNMLLYRDNLNLLQWLHVSKYPPSLSFALMTLGLMGILLALLMRIYGKGPNSLLDPLLAFGRAPLFFYLLHVHLLSGAAVLLGMWKKSGMSETFLAAGAVLVVLYPLCRWYTTTKAAYPHSILRFV